MLYNIFKNMGIEYVFFPSDHESACVFGFEWGLCGKKIREKKVYKKILQNLLPSLLTPINAINLIVNHINLS
jgi:hypothetical protein